MVLDAPLLALTGEQNINTTGEVARSSPIGLRAVGPVSRSLIE
jgi:hypothetical protein